MIKKKLLCVLLALCLMVSPIMSVCVNAAESNDIQKVSLSLYSNLTSDKYISGLYKDNVFYITTENLCKLAGAEVVSETAEEVRINLSKGMRQFCVDVGSGNMQEILETDEFNITMPSLFFEDKVYISAIHFLRYIGATVQIQEDSDCQFMVIKRYDIFDAWADYVESDYGNFFWWDEVHIGNGDIESELTKAGVIALINRDSNVFRMMFDAEGIEQEALEDALLSIVKNEGQSYFVDESPESELIGTYSDLIGAESDWFGLIAEAYSDGSDELAKQIGGLAESAAVASGFASNVVEAFEGLKQFDNMSTAQKNLLEKTILTHSDDSETLCDGWNVVYDAAYNINGKIQSEYDAQYKAALDASEATAYDFLNGATSAAGANPVSIAWSGVNLLTKLIPYTNEFIEKETQLYNSYNCSIIQLIANEIFTEAVLDWYYNNGMISNSTNQIQKLEASKYAMILQLKATITTRECLLTPGYLNEDDATEMRELNRETVNLLNRVESCKITGVNLFAAEYGDDISWIKKCTSLSDLMAILLKKTDMNPVEYFYGVFSEEGTLGMIAIYQYDSEWMEKDSCQVWYTDGSITKQLFVWENTSGNSFCNIVDAILYKSSEGIPYVVLNSWQRVAMSYENCQIFGCGKSGDIEKIFETEGKARVENGKLMLDEVITDLIDGVPEATNTRYEIDIIDGIVQKKINDSHDKYEKENVKSLVEIADYLGDDNVERVSNAIGNMEVMSNKEFKEYAQCDNLIIGILVDAPSEYNPEQINVYEQITDVKNYGNQNVSLFGICIGDSYSDIINKLYKDYDEEMLQYCITKQGDGKFQFWLGDAAVITATFADERLISYSYELRYTG